MPMRRNELFRCGAPAGSIRAVCLVLVVLGTGCTGTGAVVEPAMPSPRIAVVTSEQWVFEWHDRDTAEINLNRCLERALRADGIETIRQSEFLAAVFPDLAPEAAPKQPKYLKIALEHPEVRERVVALDLQYLVYVAGTLDMKESWRDMDVTCQVQYGQSMPVCFGGIEYEQTSWLTAVLIDVDKNAQFSMIRADDTGRSWALIPVVPIPIWNLAETQAVACEELAERIGKVLHIEAVRASK
jgi:hypothetical protein